ncbi:MAG TPA: cation diffusion facilitator family transporter [Micromonosporaceae bacterium]|nr:cation diffusion facilitator family transporter [Micromonosporaceae bacterium]
MDGTRPHHDDHDHVASSVHTANDTGAHDHDHDHGHGHGREHRGAAAWHRLTHLVRPHSHDAAAKVDAAMEGSREGLRALWISLVVLGLTAALQAIVAVASHSVALLGDTLHNVADALTAVPLGLAFVVGRRAPTRRYTYGFGRAEDLAGIVIVVVIAASSAFAAYEAIHRLAHPQHVRHLWAVAIAALIGFAGNEIVARYRIVVGRRIGSAALVADGLHARTDGFTSLAVLLGAGGVAIGWQWADPVVGLAITAAIAVVFVDAARQVYRRLMDAVDPALVDQVAATLRGTPGVLDVGTARIRWIGHQLRAECEIAVADHATIVDAHAIAHDAEHRLMHAVPRLTAAVVHAEPYGAIRGAHHLLTDAHAARVHVHESDGTS